MEQAFTITCAGTDILAQIHFRNSHIAQGNDASVSVPSGSVQVS